MSEKKRQYTVGYKKPPINTRFKPGQSGNPRGRAKGYLDEKPVSPEQLTEVIPTPRSEELKIQSKPQVNLKQLCANAVNGDAASVKDLAEFVQQHFPEKQKDNSVKEALATLENNTDRESLLAQWRDLYGTEAPARISRKFLTQAIAYRIQENAYGGLKPATKRFLEKVVADVRAGRPIPSLPIAPTPGTRLLREWHGETYEVTVLARGVLFKGKTYRSLTEVASLITGTHWSGPAFFGLRKKKLEY